MTFDEFLNSELTGLRAYATVLAGDPHRAQDVLADSLLRAHVHWSRIGSMEFPAAYVRRIVTSQFLSESRRWSVRHIRPTRTGDLPDLAVPDPASVVDDRAHLARLLATLPDRQRAAVVLRYYLDLSSDEIAAELGITAGAVRTAISRGLATLRITATDDESSGDAASRPIPGDPGVRDAPARSVDLSPVRPRSMEGS